MLEGTVTLSLPVGWPLPGIAFDRSPLIAAPREVDPLAMTMLLRDAPAVIRLEPPRYSQSANGWPLRLQPVSFFDPNAPDVERERRVLATYQFIDWIGFAMLIVHDFATFTAHEAAISTTLASGEPDFLGSRASSLWHALHRP